MYNHVTSCNQHKFHNTTTKINKQIPAYTSKHVVCAMTFYCIVIRGVITVNIIRTGIEASNLVTVMARFLITTKQTLQKF